MKKFFGKHLSLERIGQKEASGRERGRELVDETSSRRAKVNNSAFEIKSKEEERRISSSP
jgi:hypothetical protein